jgi:hypothetical protein
VPPIPKALTANLTSVKRQITYHTKAWKRREHCDRFGIGRNHKSPDIRYWYCSSHEFESVRFQVTATPPIKNPNGDLKSRFAATMEVPKPIGPKSSASGLHVHLGDENLNPRDNPQLRQPNDGTKEPLIECKPEVEIQMLTPKEVHRRTGLCDLNRLLSYVAIMCNGDFEKMITTTRVGFLFGVH